MGEWRYTLTEIRKYIEAVKRNNSTSVDISSLTNTLNQIEDNLEIKDKFLILDRMNNPTREYDKNIYHYIEAVKELNQQHRQYTQIIITAGYATYFGLWSISKPLLNNQTTKWSLLLLLISALSFICFEVFKVATEGYSLNFKNKALLKAITEDDLDSKIEKVNKAYRYDNCMALWIHRFWHISFPISVITGLLAISFIAYGLFSSL